MALAWSAEWLEEQVRSCKSDSEFQSEAEEMDRSYTAHVLADPARGVEHDYWFGFHVASMEKAFSGQANQWETDYFLEGSYADWYAVNEGEKGLVASLLDESIRLVRGSTSYLAMFVPAVERFFALSRENTDTYDGDYKAGPR